MKQIFLSALLLTTLLFTGCDEDPNPLSLDTFDVRWYDDDNSGTQTINDALGFDIKINTTDSDPDDQFITEWEFSYFVNDNFGGLLQGDENTHINSLMFEGDVYIGNLSLPGPGSLKKGDVVEFRLWCIDNYGTQMEQFHRFVLEQ